MQPPSPVIRRATLDDLPALKQLWAQAQLPLAEEERHLTEFQVVVASDGRLVGAAGLHLRGKHGKLHSEAFVHPEQEDAFRPALWERLRSVARNHGLVRLWTLEPAPFWHREAGFHPAADEERKKLPAEFGDPHAAWQTLPLRDESLDAVSLEREFELFQQAEKAATERVFRQASRLRVLAYAALVAALLAAGYFVVLLLQRGTGFLQLFNR